MFTPYWILFSMIKMGRSQYDQVHATHCNESKLLLCSRLVTKISVNNKTVETHDMSCSDTII